jgi:hypothetical protein
MESYKVKYTIEKKGSKYQLTTSVNRTLPMFLQGGHALSRAEEFTQIEHVLFERAKEIKKSLKLEVIFQLSE